MCIRVQVEKQDNPLTLPLSLAPRQFEDCKDFALGTVLPALAQAGTYRGLHSNAFVGLSNVLNTGVQPHPPQNEIVTGLPQSLTDGTAYIEASGEINYYDLKSF